LGTVSRAEGGKKADCFFSPLPEKNLKYILCFAPGRHAAHEEGLSGIFDGHCDITVHIDAIGLRHLQSQNR